MSDKNGGPDTRGLKVTGGRQEEADARRQEDLRDQCDVQRAARVSGSLQAAGIRERNGDEQSGDAEKSQQLPPKPDDGGIVETKNSKQLIWNREKECADGAGHSQSNASGNMHGACAAFRLAGAEILSCNRRRGSHEANRRPRDQGEELGVAHRVCRLRFRAFRQRANESKQHHPRDVHRHALNACGRPKRNKARMMAKSGRRGIERSKCTTRRPLISSHTPTAETEMLEIAVRIPAPFVPKAGMGPAPLINTTLRTKFRTVIATPSRNGVRASPAARNAPPSMKNISIPMLNTNIVCRNGSASARTAGVACTMSSSPGDSKYPSGARIPSERASAVRNAW